MRSLPLCGEGRPSEAEAGVGVYTHGLFVAHPHPTGLRAATLPTRGRDKETRSPFFSYATASAWDDLRIAIATAVDTGRSARPPRVTQVRFGRRCDRAGTMATSHLTPSRRRAASPS